MKRIIAAVVAVVLAASLSGCGEEKVPAAKYYEQSEELEQAIIAKTQAENKAADLEKKIGELENRNTELDNRNQELEKGNAELKARIDEIEHSEFFLLDAVKKAYAAEDWQKTVDLADEIHEHYPDSTADLEAVGMAERARVEVQLARAEQIAEETREYDTGITAAMLYYDPNSYVDSKVKITGEITDIKSIASSHTLKLVVDGYIPIDAEYQPSMFDGKVGDTVLVCGVMKAVTVSIDLVTGGQVVNPRITAEKIYIM